MSRADFGRQHCEETITVGGTLTNNVGAETGEDLRGVVDLVVDALLRLGRRLLQRRVEGVSREIIRPGYRQAETPV